MPSVDSGNFVPKLWDLAMSSEAGYGGGGGDNSGRESLPLLSPPPVAIKNIEESTQVLKMMPEQYS